MEDKIKKKLAEHGLTPDLLTKEELEQLKKEIEAEEKGELFLLDGVLSRTFYREMAEKMRKEADKKK